MFAEYFLYLPILIVAILVLMRFKKMFGQIKETKQTWYEFSKMKELTEDKLMQLDGSKWKIKYNVEAKPMLIFKGSNEGFPFILQLLRKFRGENDYEDYTRMEIQLLNLPKGLCIYKETFFNKVTNKALAIQDIKTNDKELDKFFIINGENPQEVKAFLTLERLTSIKKFVNTPETLELCEDGFYLEYPGEIDELIEMEKLYKEVGELAISLSTEKREVGVEREIEEVKKQEKSREKKKAK